MQLTQTEREIIKMRCVAAILHTFIQEENLLYFRCLQSYIFEYISEYAVNYKSKLKYIFMLYNFFFRPNK